MNNEFKHLNPDDFWPEAEKLIDGHFRKKRLIRYSVYAAIIIAVISTLTYFTLLRNESAESISRLENASANSANTTASENAPEKSSTSLSNKTANTAVEGSSTSSEDKTGDSQIASTDNLPNQNLSNSTLTDTRSKSESIASAENKRALTSTSTTADQTKERGNKKKKSGKKNTQTITTAESGSASALANDPEQSISSPVFTKKKKRKAAAATKDIPVLTPETPFTNLAASGNKQENEMISLLNRTTASLTPIEPNSNLFEKQFPSVVKKQKFQSWYMTVYGIYGTMQGDIRSADFSRYADRRNKEESYSVRPGIGVSATYRVNRLQIGTGIESTGLNIKTTYGNYLYGNVVTSQNSWQTQVINTIVTDTAFIQGLEYVYDRNISYTDSLLITTFDTTNQRLDANVKNGTLRLSYIEVPLTITYQLKGGRLGAGISAGISAAVLTGKEGNVLLPDESGQRDLSQTDLYRDLIWNVRAGFDITYQLSGRSAIYFSPQFRTSLQSIYKNESGIEQQNRSMVLLGGLRYLIK